MRLGAAEFGPVALAAVRVAGATLCLLPLLALRGQIGTLRRHWKPIFTVGLINSAAPFLLYSYAALSISAGLSSIFNAATPLFGALIAWLWLRDRLTPTRIAGLAIGFAGVLWLAWDKASFKPGGSGWAVLACLGATLCYGLAASFTKKHLAGVAPLAVATGSQLGATLALALPALWWWPAATPSPTASEPAIPAPATSPVTPPSAGASQATPAAPATTPAPAGAQPATPPAAETPAGPPLKTEAAEPFGEEVTLTGKKVLALKSKAVWDTAFETLTESIKTLTNLLAKQKITPAGPILIVYTSTDDAGFTFQAEIPVDQDPKNLTKDMVITQSPEGKMLKFVHHGSYDNMDNTYEAITNYLDDKKLEARDMFIEEYVTDPLKVEEDKLVINVFVPLK